MTYSLQRQGDEFLVNTIVSGEQYGARMFESGDGGFVVVWTDESGQGHDTSWHGVRAQRLDAAGARIGGEFGINMTTPGTQYGLGGTSLADGRFVVTWNDLKTLGDSREMDFRGQIFNADGTTSGGEFLIPTIHAKAQNGGGIVALAGGGFVATWSDNSSAIPGMTNGRIMKAQIFDDMGAKIGEEFVVNTVMAGNEHSPSIGALPSGGFVVTFVSVPNTGLGTIEFQIFDAAGNKVGAQRSVNEPVMTDMFHSNIAALASGFVVTWAEEGVPHTFPVRTFVIKAQLFDQSGEKVGGEILVDPARTAQDSHGVAAMPEGDGFVITWSRPVNQDYDDHDVLAQVYRADGTKVGAELVVSGVTAGMQMDPKAVALPSGDIVITWSDASGVGGDTSGFAIKAQLLARAVEPTEGDDVLTGTPGNDVINGRGGNDTMSGGQGNDRYIVDSAGDVVIEYAGEGTDIVYSAVSYSLNDGSEVESLSTITWEATNALNLTGNALANQLIGNAGANQLNGKGGADTMIGREGNDKYLVDNALDRAFEAAGGGTDVVYTGVSFVLTDAQEIEGLSTITWELTTAINLTGNGLKNNIIGNAGANVLDGKGGNDTLQGREGADSYAFTSVLGAGNVDKILGFSAADDTILLENNGVFVGLAVGALNPNAFVIGTAAQDSSDRIVYDQATGRLFFDADGNGAGAQIQFALLDGAPIIAAGDFTVI